MLFLTMKIQKARMVVMSLGPGLENYNVGEMVVRDLSSWETQMSETMPEGG